MVKKRKEHIMEIQVINFSKYQSGKLKGFFDMQYGVLIITGCMYFINGEKRWFAFPQKHIEDKDGQSAYQEIIQFTTAAFRYLRKEVLRQIDALSQQPEKNKRPSSKSHQKCHRTPEGEDLSQYYSLEGEDIPF